MNQRFITRLLLACGVIGSLLFIIVFLIEGATRPGYSAWRHAVSQLSLGDQGWMNSINIFVCGLTLLCGVLFIIAAIFPVNPALGYPRGVAPTYSLHGLIHALAVTIFFGCLTALCFVLGQRFVDGADWTGWALYSRITSAVVALFYIATSVVTTLDMNGLLPNAPGGLLQRVAIISGFGWIMLLALRLLRQEKQVRASRSENLRTYVQE